MPQECVPATPFQDRTVDDCDGGFVWKVYEVYYECVDETGKTTYQWQEVTRVQTQKPC